MILPSLETRWLKTAKDLPQPLVVVGSLAFGAGCYYQPRPGETQIGNRFYDTRRGILAIDENNANNGADVANTIAHEWRHHWQRHNQGLYYDWPISLSFAYDTYRHAIVTYFTTSYCEMDALLFSLRKRPNDLTLEWYEWILAAK